MIDHNVVIASTSASLVLPPEGTTAMRTCKSKKSKRQSNSHLPTSISTSILFYGPPSTGKTMRAKAVAHCTKAAFIAVVGSEFGQKYVGDRTRMAPCACDSVHRRELLIAT
jgi:AAA+ superfamily predicted ATPase